VVVSTDNGWFYDFPCVWWLGSTASQQAAQEYVAAQIRAEYERAYQMASLDAQLRMHAAEIAEELHAASWTR
jgi:hypothetical protein